MTQPEPKKPAQVDPLASELLEGLARCPEAHAVVLGGYFALKHYCDYRLTHDVDAWWSDEATEAAREKVRAMVTDVCGKICAQAGLSVNRRRFGDTESWELVREGVKVFSFQISARTLRLEPYLPSPWPPVQIETLADNVGSKMNALVQRGAPRDFVDIRSVVRSRLLTPGECWVQWQRKNPDLDPVDARAEVVRHLEEIELRRPLEKFNDAAERESAHQVRAWFRQQFLKLPSP